MKFSSFVRFAAFGVKTILTRGKKPILGTVIITDKCNLKCKHCSVNNITAIVHPYEQVKREIFFAVPPNRAVRLIGSRIKVVLKKS